MSGLYTALFDPKAYTGGLPVDSGAPIIHKDVSIYGVFTPGTDIPTSGALVWNVYKGYNSFLLYGFYQGAMYISYSPNNTTVVTNNVTFPALQPVPLVQQLTLSPQLSQTISMGRNAVGMIKLYSATTSTTVAALNGQLAASAITDLRNLSSWSPPDLSQNAFTAKDCVANVKASEGVVAIIGPDVNTELTAIDKTLTVPTGDGALVSIYVAPTTMSQSSTMANVLTITNGWTSPPGGFPVLSTFFPTMYAGQSFSVRLTIDGNGTAVISTLTFRIGAIMVRGDPDGTLDLITDYNVYQNVVISGNALATSTATTGNWCDFDLSYTGGVDTALRCVGIGIECLNTNAATFQLTKIDVKIHNAYDLDTIGSYRVLRWDNITSNQTLNIMGTTMVDGIPTGSIAPYVKSDHTIPRGVGSIMADLCYVFSEPSTGLKRIYTYPEYQLIKESRGKDYELIESINETSNPQHAAAGMYGAYGMYGAGTRHSAGLLSDANPRSSKRPRVHQAGLFGGIGSALGSAAGDALDDITGGLFGASTVKKSRQAMHI